MPERAESEVEMPEHVEENIDVIVVKTLPATPLVMEEGEAESVRRKLVQLQAELSQAQANLADLRAHCTHHWVHRTNHEVNLQAERVPDSEWKMLLRHTGVDIVCTRCGLQHSYLTNSAICRCCLQAIMVWFVAEPFGRRPAVVEPFVTMERFLRSRLNGLSWGLGDELYIPYCGRCKLFTFWVDKSRRGEH